MRARAAFLALLLALAPGCTDEQRAMWCRAANTVDVIKTAVGFAFPFLAPQLAGEYAILSAAVDTAKGKLLAACAKGADQGPAIDVAVSTSIDLIKWWQVHRAEVAAMTPADGTRAMRAPDDSAQVLSELLAFQAERARGSR